VINVITSECHLFSQDIAEKLLTWLYTTVTQPLFLLEWISASNRKGILGD